MCNMSKYTLRPYVSVIITIFNNTQYIDQCIKSVLYQTLKNIEIICIVDDSTDNAFEKISLYQKNDKRIHILRQKNQYVGAARNSGLIHASGKYVYFLDSDDFIEPTWVNFHSKCKMLGGVAEFFSEAFLCRFPPEDLPRPVVYPVHSLPV